MPIDLVRRLASTPLASTLEISGTIVRLMTDSPTIQRKLRRLFPAHIRRKDNAQLPVWRIVAEPDDDVPSVAEPPTIHSMKLDGLAFVRIGRQSFLAWDQQAGRGISFLAQSLANNERLFSQYFLAALRSFLTQ